MSYTIGEIVACEKIQAQLNAVFCMPDTSMITVPSPLLQFLASEQNCKGVQQVVVPSGTGHIKTLRAIYEQRLTKAAVTSNQTHPTCTATTKRGNAFQDYTLDPSSNEQIEETFSLTELIEGCEANDLWIARHIARMVNALDEKIAYKTAIEATALNGAWGSTASTTQAPVVANQLNVRTTRASATDELYPFALQEINSAALKSAFTQPYAIFGGDVLGNYFERMAMGCCANQGLDLSQMFAAYRKAFAYDHWVQDALGGQQYSLMLQLGALQLLNFSLFDGPQGFNMIDQPTYRQQSITSPKTGVKYDLITKYDCGNFHVIITGITKVVGLPNDLFPVGDLYTGVNFVTEIKALNT